MEGCPPPRVRDFEVDLKLKPDAQPRVLQPFPLSEFDPLRLELHEDPEVPRAKPAGRRQVSGRRGDISPSSSTRMARDF